MSNEEKSCFVIAPIGDQDSDTRKRSDQVLRHVIRPAAETCGYQAIRADEIDKPGMITSQVIQHIVNDPLVIADLTERNPNVFYELAIRHALRKPLVQLIKKGEQIPFDVAGSRTIHVDHRDLDSVESAKNQIVEQVRALEADSTDIETPISVSLDLQLLRQSEKPEERSLADLVAAVSDIRSGLSKLESKIGTSDEDGVLDEIQKAIRVLPMRIEEHSDSFPLGRSKRGRRFHPMMFREMLERGPGSHPATGVLMMASLFRESLPWVYELGMEAYRVARNGRPGEARQALQEFQHSVEMIAHGPGREFLGRNKEMFMLMEEMEPMIEQTMREMELRSDKLGVRRPAPEDLESD